MAFHSRRNRRHRASRFRTRRHGTTKKVPDVPPVQENIKAGQDFYKYVNANWQKHVHMPSYLSSFGVSEEIEIIVEKQLKDILYDCRSFHVHFSKYYDYYD